MPKAPKSLLVENWFLIFRCEVETLFQGHLIKFISCCSLGLLSDNHSVLSCMSPGSLTSVETLPRPSSGSTRTVPTVTHTNKIRNIFFFDLAIFLKFKSCWMNGMLQIKIKWFIRMLKIRNGSSLTAMKTLTFFKTLKYVYIYPVAIKGIFFPSRL